MDQFKISDEQLAQLEKQGRVLQSDSDDPAERVEFLEYLVVDMLHDAFWEDINALIARALPDALEIKEAMLRALPLPGYEEEDRLEQERQEQERKPRQEAPQRRSRASTGYKHTGPKSRGVVAASGPAGACACLLAAGASVQQ
jgi:hypothetical protein